MREQTILTKEERKRFCDEYLNARDQGMTRREAYYYAKKVLATEGISAPAFNTLIHWLRYGLPKDGVQDTGPSPAAAEQEPEATEIAACGNEAEEGEREKGKEEREEENANRIDRATLYRALLRLYRYRREEDIDAVVDLTVPDLLGEEA